MIHKVTEKFSVTLWFNGNMRRTPHNSILILLAMIFLATACTPAVTPTAFRPPTQIPPTQPLATVTAIPMIYTLAPTITLTPTATGICVNDLEFISDVTIEDNTVVQPNSSIDKQWLVQNTGTCNWDEKYRLKWIGGDPLGAAQEQELYPARAGTQATLRILFNAPNLTGTYESSWQAMSPDGNLFGELIYMKVTISP